MSELISAIQTTYLQGQGGVKGFGPAGEISADSFKLYQSQGQADGYVLAFKGNVRLIYFPEHE
jgi:lipopolysaccharide export system protein LptC